MLTGAVNPSGRLPFTFPLALEDGPLKTERQYPGILPEGEKWWQEYYDEGVFVGYRWYDTEGIPVLFPFGYGLSYTQFRYSNWTLSKKTVKCSGSYGVSDEALDRDILQLKLKVTNTGKRAGSEVVELFVSAPDCGVERPVRELKGFDKVFLNAGESEVVSIPLQPSSFARFDEDTHAWVVDPGTYAVIAGPNPEDLRCRLELTIL